MGSQCWEPLEWRDDWRWLNSAALTAACCFPREPLCPPWFPSEDFAINRLYNLGTVHDLAHASSGRQLIPKEFSMQSGGLAAIQRMADRIRLSAVAPFFCDGGDAKIETMCLLYSKAPGISSELLSSIIALFCILHDVAKTVYPRMAGPRVARKRLAQQLPS